MQLVFQNHLEPLVEKAVAVLRWFGLDKFRQQEFPKEPKCIQHWVGLQLQTHFSSFECPSLTQRGAF